MKQLLTLNAAAPLPETLAAGDILEVQLAPFGDFPGLCAGRRVTQRCDAEAFARLVKAFEAEGAEALVDFEHRAELGGDTAAAAWVERLRVDPERGLMADFRFTDLGAEAVAQRRLRFLSPVWELDEAGRPARLVSVGLTNKPNLPVRPILNRAGADTPSVEDTQDTPTMMEQLIGLLGLAPEASEEEILAAVRALREQIARQEEDALRAEAEQAAEENKDRIANKAAFTALYVRSPEAAKAFLACTRAPQAPAPVCNKSEARTPAQAGGGLAACRTPEERCDWIARHL